MTEQIEAHTERFLEACAEAAHEANRIYCAVLGDASQVHWADAPEWQKHSARQGVMHALAGSKAADGWRHGPVKDAEKKEHPCMLPYTDLPREQRAKDDLFLAVVAAMAGALRGEVA